MFQSRKRSAPLLCALASNNKELLRTIFLETEENIEIMDRKMRMLPEH
jgi:hypothetical protein